MVFIFVYPSFTSNLSVYFCLYIYFAGTIVLASAGRAALKALPLNRDFYVHPDGTIVHHVNKMMLSSTKSVLSASSSLNTKTTMDLPITSGVVGLLFAGGFGNCKYNI
jgi:hypothetical protein